MNSSTGNNGARPLGNRARSCGSLPSWNPSSRARSSYPKRQGKFGRSQTRGGDPTKVERLLTSAFKHLGIAKDIQRYQFVLHWDEIVGSELAQVCRPECLIGNALIVRVRDSAWAQELSLKSAQILEPLKRYFEKNGSKSFEVPEIDELRFFSGEF